MTSMVVLKAAAVHRGHMLTLDRCSRRQQIDLPYVVTDCQRLLCSQSTCSTSTQSSCKQRGASAATSPTGCRRPPAIFVPVITALEIACYIHQTLTLSVPDVDVVPAFDARDAASLSSFDRDDVRRLLQLQHGTGSHPHRHRLLPTDSIFIYRPDRRLELWRFALYMLVHAGWQHVLFNSVAQLLVGVPLELVHGSLKTGLVYMSGVVAGSLATSVVDMNAILVGASGGVYALIAAHLPSVLLNYSQVELGFLKLLAVCVIAFTDVVLTILEQQQRRSSVVSRRPSVGYVTHLTGAVAGLLTGILVLRSRSPSSRTSSSSDAVRQSRLRSSAVTVAGRCGWCHVIWWLALVTWTTAAAFAVVWNIVCY